MKKAVFYDHILDMCVQENMSTESALSYAKDLGIELLEISENNIKDDSGELKNRINFFGMHVSCLCAYFDFAHETDINKRGIGALENAARLEAQNILVIPGFFKEGISKEEKYSEKMKMIETLIKFTEAANKYGLTVLMEEYDSSDAPFSTSQGLRDYLDPVPDLFCTFDTGNFIYNDEDVFQAYELFRDKICHVHLKDRTVERIYDQDQGKNSADGTKVFYPAPVGEGMLNLEDIVKRLKQDGYDGIYTIEHYGASRQKEFLRKSSKWIDRNFDIL